VTGHHSRRADRFPVDCWTILGAAVVALVDRGASVRLDGANIERVHAAAGALFRELTEPDAVQKDAEPWLCRLGTRVRTAREGAGLTQAELADAAEMEEPTVARCEAGDREMTAFDMAVLARALGVFPGALVPPAEPPSDPGIPVGK
jgi:DNA-binding XRE family transcriptional regulator